MSRSVVETVMGAIVLLVAAVFLAQAYKVADLAPRDSYPVTAKFTSIDGLTLGSDVRLGGVKIGTVTDQRVDQEFYQALVTLSIDETIRLPEDSAVSIVSDGLLGGKYVKIVNGGSERMIEAGENLADTKDVLVLEELLGRVIFLVTED